jgi:hypothetical protein
MATFVGSYLPGPFGGVLEQTRSFAALKLPTSSASLCAFHGPKEIFVVTAEGSLYCYTLENAQSGELRMTKVFSLLDRE